MRNAGEIGCGLLMVIFVFAIWLFSYATNPANGSLTEAETVIVFDQQITGRLENPTLILKTSRGFEEFYFRAFDEMAYDELDRFYTCADKGEKIQLRRIVGIYGHEIGMILSCNWGDAQNNIWGYFSVR